MEAQLHHTHGHHHDHPLHPADADLLEEDEHGVKKSEIEKVKTKVHKLKATIKDGHGHHDEEHHNHAEKIMNESPAVRSGLVEPTDMGKAVLAEDLYATHSDILDTPVRSFAQWEEEERSGAPPPLPTGIYGTGPAKVGHHGFNQNVNREQLRGSIEKSTGMEEHPSAPNPATAVSPANRQTEVPAPTKMTGLSQVGHHEDQNREQIRGAIGKSTGMVQDPSSPNPTMVVSPANHQTKVTDPTKTGGKEAGITDVLRSFNKMGVYDEPHSKSSESDQKETKVYTGSYDHSKSSESDQNEPEVHAGSHDQYSRSSESDQIEPKVYTGSHDQFAPEPVEDAPLSTVAGDPSSHSSSYTNETSATSDKAAVAKDLMVSKLGSSGENKSETNSSSSPTNYAHKVAETVTGTLGPVYETVVGVGSSVMSKMQGSERPAETRITEKKGGSVKDYLVETLRPGDEDKVVSDVITHAFHRNDPPVQETTSTTIYVRDEGGEGRRLQESGN
ncbi:low-temperature-induced 65 kDa protein-like [Cynara cardunculus var. scolymus]|uniref:low-temperature-induced 65 kDa protein-like n=1 Tax=Cynara cardunculus var. scolymus TaxID=59895 RepID=UPI000D629D87|nr:low-temperature-induced 65 kDa protein-like [Cynara cardunculus var. scolymus]